jgi:aromatic ring-opening dioxygenase catalytic subunit (LigB family)
MTIHAFPSGHNPKTGMIEHGMTLRDYFAAKALAVCPLSLPTEKANWSYQMADAMLKARDE